MTKISPRIIQGQLTALHNKEISVIYALLELTKYKTAINGAYISIDISQQQLSTVTGLSRPRITEVLKKLEKNNEISIQRNKLYLKNINALGERLELLNCMFHDPRK